MPRIGGDLRKFSLIMMNAKLWKVGTARVSSRSSGAGFGRIESAECSRAHFCERNLCKSVRRPNLPDDEGLVVSSLVGG